MRLVNNTFFAPYYIFIKANSRLSDIELFEKLGLKGYELIRSEEGRKLGLDNNKRYLYTADDGKWKHLMDDSYYSLWYNKELRMRIKNLSYEFDIFCCSIGDCDYSFDFVFYQKGNLTRKYVVDDPKINGGFVKENIGKAFEIEPIALTEKDQLDKVLKIAEWLGISIQHNLETIRCYEILDEKMINSFDFQDGY